jgi:hypothetical protein
MGFWETLFLLLPLWSLRHPWNALFHLKFRNPRTVGRKPCLRDQPVTRPLPTQTHNKWTSMTCMGFKPMIPAFVGSTGRWVSWIWAILEESVCQTTWWQISGLQHPPTWKPHLTIKHYQDPWESYITMDCTLTSWSRVPPFYEPMAHICFKNHWLKFTHFWVSWVCTTMNYVLGGWGTEATFLAGADLSLLHSIRIGSRGLSLQVKCQGMKLTSHLNLVLRLRMMVELHLHSSMSSCHGA